MKYYAKKVASFIKCHGGKNRYARQYISIFPSVEKFPIYIEPYFGGGGILMNKERSQKEIINDIDENIFRTIAAIQGHREELLKYIKSKYMDYSESAFRKAKSQIGVSSLVVHAASYIAANRMSRGGLFQNFAESDRLRGGQMGDKNAWENFILKHYYSMAIRFSKVIVTCECALETIRGYCDLYPNECLFYLDPPYLKETRVSPNIYLHEVDKEHHIQLLSLITKYQKKAKFFLSGYDSPLYREYLKSWTAHQFNRPSDAGQTKVKTRRMEMVWENPL